MVEFKRIDWSDLTPEEKLDMIPHLLNRLHLEIWFYKFDGEARSLELRKVPDEYT